MRASGALSLLTLSSLLMPATITARAAAPSHLTDDEKTLAAAKVGTDGPALLQFVRQRTLTDDNRRKVEALLRLLGDEAFAKREQASRDLVALGPVALPLLRQALASPDAEVRRRVKVCMARIDSSASNALMAAVIRLISIRKPSGSAEVLLAHLPFAEEVVAEEVRTALATVAVSDGWVEPVVTKALQDKVAARRAAAAEALCRAGVFRPVAAPTPQLDLDGKFRISPARVRRPVVYKLLQDADPQVRLRVAIVLADIQDAEAFPVLIALLGELPAEAVWEAEAILRGVAGDKAPAVLLGDDQAGRRKCRDAWAAWWKEHGAKIDLAKINLSERTLGYTLLVMQVDKDKGGGRVREVGKDGKTRWEIGGLGYPLDASVVPGNHVLIVDKGRVTERNLKGEILWEKPAANPTGAQRLANGNTMIVSGAELIEVDRDGKEVAKIVPQLGYIVAVKKLRNGQIGCLSNSAYALLDANGKRLKSWPVSNVATVGGLDVLPNGGIVIAQVFANKVIEYDASGKVKWEANFTAPTSVVRLRNGNTLVAAWNTGQVAELNAKGKIVWEYKANAEYSRARRR
jgi:HEAT repeat protein